jgi:ABC-2 type transport system ATP-binding protein
VATGTITELVSAGPRLIRIDAPDTTPGWCDTVPGCRILDVDGSHMLLELTPDADDQAVLNAALAGGPVHEFTHVRRTLSELFGIGADDLAVWRPTVDGQHR